MFQGLTFVALFLLFGLSGNIAHGETQLQPLRTASRGELLYSTHCIACHNTQIHWREKKLVSNWKSLLSEVQRWQETLMLEWNKDDNKEVARYLNVIYYRYTAAE